MANERSKLDKLIAAGATAEELAQVREEDESGLTGQLRREKRLYTGGVSGYYPAQLPAVELAERKAQADHRAAMQQRSQDIQDYGDKRGYDARMARLKQEAQALEERKFRAQSEPLKPID